MYKKIKNSSFMNLIWFIVSIMPIFLLTIFTINIVNNKDIENKYQTQINQNTFNITTFETSTQSQLVKNTNKNTFTLQNLSRIRHIYLYQTNNTTYDQLEYNKTYYIKFFGDNEQTNYYIDLNYDTITNLVFNQSNNYYNELTINSNEQTISVEINFSGDLEQTTENRNGNYWLFISEQPFDYTNEFIINYTNDYNLYSIDTQNIYSIYQYYLEYTLETIKTNGFISSAFLNLSTLFGVNNIYYSLACYYIEYLLVIALLHLAFDVLYMLPNICHKFMEKLGGERD